LEKFGRRRLEEDYPYLMLDAGYEKAREDGAVRSQAVLIAIGIDWEGRRNVLAVELANREELVIRATPPGPRDYPRLAL
jgi:putative transposase